MRTEKRSRPLSISKKNQDAENIIEDYSNKWGMPFSQTVFRIAKEYDQMRAWAFYNQALSSNNNT